MPRLRTERPLGGTGDFRRVKEAQRQLLVEMGKRMEWARDERDYKQYWVPVAAGLDPSRYNRIVHGTCQRVYIDEVERIATVLSCSVDWLLRGAPFQPWLPGTAPVRGT